MERLLQIYIWKLQTLINNELEYWLNEWGYSEWAVRQEISRAQKVQRYELLEKKHNHQDKNKLTINITY